MKARSHLLMVASLLCSGVAAALAQSTEDSASQKMVLSLLADLACFQDDEKHLATNIATFDTLDFDVFTNQKWDRLRESYSKDVIVHWPDGHQTKGIDVHIADLKAMFVMRPIHGSEPIRSSSARRMDSGHRCHGGNVHKADASGRWQDNCSDRQELQADNSHSRSLERQRDGRGIPVLG